MSQWTLIKSQMKDLDCIKSALDEMSYEYESFPAGMKQRGRMLDLQVKRQKDIPAAIGFIKSASGEYEMQMAEYTITDEVQAVLNRLKRTYTTHKSIKQTLLATASLGCMVTSKEVDASGNTRIRLMATNG